MTSRTASWMLQRLTPTNVSEERRFLDGFLQRMHLSPTEIEKSECPDFFLTFARADATVRVGCEVVRFHSHAPRTDASLGDAHPNVPALL